MKKLCLLIIFSALFSPVIFSQNDTVKSESDTLSDFDSFNKKAEKLFKYLPFPLYSYSTDAGHVFGLAKYNIIELDKRDTLSQPSKISEVATFSTVGRINISVSTDLIWGEDRYMVLGFINYKRQREYIFGIGNDVSIDDIEDLDYSRFRFVNYGFLQVKKDLYIGIGFDISDYTQMKYDSTSFLVRDSVTGAEAVTNFGIGLSVAWDSRDNRYNAHSGSYFRFSAMGYPTFIGNPYHYYKFNIDGRKYFNPWYRHVIALQLTTSFRTGDVPFYDLAFMGGDSKMRGWYEGALRDNVLIDGQVEYRIPIWNIFGAVAWLGTGRVAESYSDLSIHGFWPSWGFGLRIKVDSAHDTNLRFDYGFGKKGVSAFYINFAEAF